MSNPFTAAAAAAGDEKPVWRLSPFEPQRYIDMPYNEEPVSSIPECVRSKVYNRFMDVLPNPRTRVQLRGDAADPASEYINANYVHGFDGSFPAYIAAMGPLPATVDTFWRAVWEHKVTCVVMATGLEEGGKIKCERYWPDQFCTEKYGELTVEWMAAERCEGFLMTRLRASLGKEQLVVHHFWYNTWPDHGVPATSEGAVFPDHIIKMLHVVHEKAGEGVAPILVHCSAGIGRTGAIIAIDHCLSRLTQYRFVDVCAVIEYIRRDRCALVQHPNQYELVYQACVRYASMRRHLVEVGREPPPDLPKEALAAASPLPAEKRASAPKKIIEGAISSDEEDEETARDVEPELPRGKPEDLRRDFLDHVHKPWFHGVMSRELSEDVLRQAGLQEGSFLVRESPSTPGQYVISLATDGEIYHNRVIYHEGLFRTTRAAFPTVAAVLEYYTQPRDEFQAVLKEPVCCQRPRTLSVVSSLNPRELELISKPANAAERSQLPPKLAQLETRKAGWLFKQGGGRDVGAFSISGKTGGLFARKNWKKRFFVLQDTIIKYYKAEITSGCEEALGYINLSSESSIEVLTDRSFAIHTLRRTFLIYADGVEAAQEWVAVLEGAVKKIQASMV